MQSCWTFLCSHDQFDGEGKEIKFQVRYGLARFSSPAYAEECAHCVFGCSATPTATPTVRVISGHQVPTPPTLFMHPDTFEWHDIHELTPETLAVCWEKDDPRARAMMRGREYLVKCEEVRQRNKEAMAKQASIVTEQ